MNDYCVCCGAIIPEGRQVCYSCERMQESKDHVVNSAEQKPCATQKDCAKQTCPRKRYRT